MRALTLVEPHYDLVAVDHVFELREPPVPVEPHPGLPVAEKSKRSAGIFLPATVSVSSERAIFTFISLNTWRAKSSDRSTIA